MSQWLVLPTICAQLEGHDSDPKARRNCNALPSTWRVKDSFHCAITMCLKLSSVSFMPRIRVVLGKYRYPCHGPALVSNRGGEQEHHADREHPRWVPGVLPEGQPLRQTAARAGELGALNGETHVFACEHRPRIRGPNVVGAAICGRLSPALREGSTTRPFQLPQIRACRGRGRVRNRWPG